MADPNQQLVATLIAFRDIAAPLMNAVTETGGINANVEGRAEHTPENHAAIFAQLMELTGNLTKRAAMQLGAQNLPADDWVRWQLAATVASLVASYYRATAQPITTETADSLLPAMIRASMDATPLDAVPQNSPSTVSSRAKAINSLIPALSAIARFAFGRPETELMGEIADKLKEKAHGLSADADDAVPEDEKIALYDGLLEALGKIYAESHYAEMDRLLDMPPEERARYVQSYDNKPPIDPVWQAFQLRVDMLSIITQHVFIADSAQIKPPV